MNITVAAISHDFVLVQWVVLEIAFTPETYELHYRPVISESEEDINTVTRTSGDDFTQRDTMHTAIVDALEPGTQYGFFIRATNSEGTTLSEQGNFTTRASGIYIYDINVLVVNITIVLL